MMAAARALVAAALIGWAPAFAGALQLPAAPGLDQAGWQEVPFRERAPGPLGTWRAVRVDVAADYQARFGEPPPEMVELAIGADSDDTASRTSGRIADLAFRPAC
jgi:hypothetical protein